MRPVQRLGHVPRARRRRRHVPRKVTGDAACVEEGEAELASSSSKMLVGDRKREARVWNGTMRGWDRKGQGRVW
jgi:hypothetical protein